MKDLFIIAGLLICSILALYLPLNFFFFSCMGIAVSLSVVYHYADYYRQINHYRNIYTDIHVVSNHPVKGKQIKFDETLEALIVCVPHEEVLKTVKEIENWLIESGNENYCDPDLDDETQRLKVEPEIFRDGVYASESWKEFNIRTVMKINERISKRHEIMKRDNPEWYNKHSNKQKGVK